MSHEDNAAESDAQAPDGALDRYGNPADHPSFNQFVATFSALRAPDGCPWDREQTHEGARDKEGAAICAELDKLGPDVHVALLAIDGKERSSVGISQRIDSLALAGKSSFAFVIGGSDGVSAEVRARADELLSFGPITLPHNLARVVLLEQLYRAQKISHGEPYHK